MDAMSQAIGAADADDMSHRIEMRDIDDNEVYDDDDDDAELKKVLEESEKAENERMQKLEKQKTEEDIVMEYVRKQSLLEEEHRQRVASGRDTSGEGNGTGAGR
jgi:hypothetical protein